MKNSKSIGGKSMTRRRFFSSLGAILLALGVLMSSLTYSFAVEDNEYIDSNAVHLDTYNLEGIKNYLQFSSKKDDSNYWLSVNNECYLYGWNSNTNVCAATKSGDADYYNFVTTDLSDDSWVSAFDSQKSNKDGYHTLFDYYTHANTEITKNYYISYYTSSQEDMADLDLLKLTNEEKSKYYVPTYYIIADIEDTSHTPKITEDEYNNLDDATKSLYKLYQSEHYYVPRTMSYTLSSGATLLSSGCTITLDDSISYYMVYDAYKNYIGTFKLSDIAGLYTSDFSDCTAKPSITAKATVKDYNGNPLDTAYVDIEYKLGNGYDYITSVVDTETKDSLGIYGSDLKNAIRVTLYNASNKEYNLEITTDMGAKTTVVAKVTEIGKKDTNTGDEEGEDIDEGMPDESVPAPKVSFTGIDKETSGTYLTITMNTDIPAEMTFNGSTDGGYNTSSEFTIYSNGTYHYSAVGENGKETTGSIDIKCFKNSDDNSDDVKEYDNMIFYDSADEGYDSSVLPQTGITATMIIISILLVVTGIVLLVKGGKINVKKK